MQSDERLKKNYEGGENNSEIFQKIKVLVSKEKFKENLSEFNLGKKNMLHQSCEANFGKKFDFNFNKPANQISEYNKNAMYIKGSVKKNDNTENLMSNISTNFRDKTNYLNILSNQSSSPTKTKFNNTLETVAFSRNIKTENKKNISIKPLNLILMSKKDAELIKRIKVLEDSNKKFIKIKNENYLKFSCFNKILQNKILKAKTEPPKTSTEKKIKNLEDEMKARMSIVKGISYNMQCEQRKIDDYIHKMRDKNFEQSKILKRYSILKK